MKKILVPTDFSTCAQSASEVALVLAEKSGAELYFLHICEADDSQPHVPYGLDHPKQGHLVKEARAKSELYELVRRAEKLGLKATPILVFDKGNEKIENYINPLQIDFVVIGSHGAKGIREFFIGSNTQRVVKRVKVPVLVVKELPSSLEFKNIVFASVFEENTIEAFKEVAAFAALLHAQVHLVYINFIDHPVDRSVAEARMKSIAERYPEITFSSNMADTNDEEYAIHQFADELQADLISLTTHDSTGFANFSSASIAEDLVNHEEKPVLVLNNP